MKNRLIFSYLLSLLLVHGAFAETSTVESELPAFFDLEGVLDYTLQHNPDIRAARERLEEQAGVILEVRSQALPRIAAQASLEHTDPNLSSVRQQERWTIVAQARQTVYQGGSVSAAIRAQNYAEAAAIQELHGVIEAVITAARTRYYEVLFQRARIAVEEQNVQLLEEQLGNTRNRFESGSVSQFEVLRAEVFLANAQPRLIRAHNGLRNATDRLRQTLGILPQATTSPTLPEIRGHLNYRKEVYTLDSLLTQAYAQRPEIEQLRLLTEARDAGVNVAQGDYLPKVELVGGYAVNKNPIRSSYDASLEGWTVGVEASWSIFDGAATRGRVRQAYSQLRQSEIETDRVRLAIEVEVREAHSAWLEANELHQAAEKVVSQGEEAYRLANARFEVGAATQLDVLQAQVSLAEARNQELEATYLHEVARARIEKAIGAAHLQ